jgi:hypothetical protein
MIFMFIVEYSSPCTWITRICSKATTRWKKAITRKEDQTSYIMDVLEIIFCYYSTVSKKKKTKKIRIYLSHISTPHYCHQKQLQLLRYYYYYYYYIIILLSYFLFSVSPLWIIIIKLKKNKLYDDSPTLYI